MSDRALIVALHQAAPIPLDLSFTCAPGEVVAIFGPSGSGKTTILRAIAGLYRTSGGRVQCGRETWLDTAAAVDVAAHRRRVGFVFQDYALFPHMTALGNVIAALGHHAPSGRRARAEHLLDLVGLSEHRDAKPARLSGGERQRVAVARALARDPAVLLLDEPFAAVDRAIRRSLQDEIDDIRRALDIPLVLVTHDFEDVVRLATHLLILEGGTAVAAGPIGELTSRPDLAWLRDSIGLGSLFEATVERVHGDRGLLELAFDGGTLLAPGHTPAVGARVRVRVPGREVILATTTPVGLSLHNVLRGTVTVVEVDETDRAVVQLAIGGIHLLAEVTRDAVTQLRIEPGVRLYALVKSVSLEVLATA